MSQRAVDVESGAGTFGSGNPTYNSTDNVRPLTAHGTPPLTMYTQASSGNLLDADFNLKRLRTKLNYDTHPHLILSLYFGGLSEDEGSFVWVDG